MNISFSTLDSHQRLWLPFSTTIPVLTKRSSLLHSIGGQPTRRRNKWSHVGSGIPKPSERSCTQFVSNLVSDTMTRLFLGTLKKTKYILQALIVFILRGRSAEQIQVESGTPTSTMVLECRTDPGGKWYSHKHNGPGVSYEVCVDTVKDRIV
ncbi:hypothetical protein ACHAXN_000186 [Cyclotella atomus]